jgi:hypothetical protein
MSNMLTRPKNNSTFLPLCGLRIFAIDIAMQIQKKENVFGKIWSHYIVICFSFKIEKDAGVIFLISFSILPVKITGYIV